MPDLTPLHGVLLDVEGTTTPVAFVYERLFPHARAELRAFLERQKDAATRADLEALHAQHAADRLAGLAPPAWDALADTGAAAAYGHWLMDRDSKATPLKALQGRIWEQGYASGALSGEVYPDVPAALERWAGLGLGVWIFSSGSVLAQRLLFAHSSAGDLTPFLRGHFDTEVGAKREALSYERICAGIGLAARSVLFVSDVVPELDAARAAGLRTALCLRGGSAHPGGTHAVVRSFDELELTTPMPNV